MAYVNVLIIEDSPEVISTLEALVQSMGCDVITVIDNTDEAMLFIYNSVPDLIFINTTIKGKYSGYELTRKIRSLHIPVIHIPPFDLVEEEYENGSPNPVQHTFFKSERKLTLYASIALGFYAFRNAPQHKHTIPDQGMYRNGSDFRLTDSVFIKKGNALHKVYFKDILYIKADGNYCEIQTPAEKFIHKITLTKLVNILPERDFLKIHRSYVVHLNHIRKFYLSRNELTVGNFIIPVGKGYKNTFMNCVRKI